MAEGPSWLDNAAPAAPTAAAADAAPAMGSLNIESSTGAGGASNTAATAAAAAEADKDLPSIILFMRLVNMGAAGALIAISVSYYIYT